MKLKHFLLTALLLFAGVSGVYAERHYVGFSSGNTDNNKLSEALGAAGPNDTVFVAAGLYLADATEFTVKQNVTLIGGYAKGDIGATTRRYPGQFVPFDSSNLSTTTKFTILDGNAYKTLPAQRHRVVTVNAGGVVDGCLIRNGHVRNSNGGGVLLNGGKLYNSIVRGNVAMNHPDSAEALGGGVFIQAGGELVNCLVAYNMANDGYGVAAGQGGGKMINNTITANTYSPVFAKIPGTPTGQSFQMYKGSNSTISYRPAINGLDTIPKFAAKIELSDFYLSRILTTEGQYAVFCAAMDIPKSGEYGQLNIDTLKNLQNPVYAGTIEARYTIGAVSPALQNMLRVYSGVNEPGLNYANGVWFPIGDTSTVEYPMGRVSWYGALAYAVWLGGGLPTEAQWEYAARRNQDGTLSENLYSGAFGSSYNASKDAASDAADTATWRVLDTIAWVAMAVSMDTSGTGYKTTEKWGPSRPHEVARKRPNAMGIYDMTGNVSEWQADRWGVINIYTTGSKDPISSTASNERTYRGGAWSHSGRWLFSLTYRNSEDKNVAAATIGVRPVVAF